MCSFEYLKYLDDFYMVGGGLFLGLNPKYVIHYRNLKFEWYARVIFILFFKNNNELRGNSHHTQVRTRLLPTRLVKVYFIF